MEQPIRLVALDMDGTLLNDRKQLTPGTIAALRLLREKRIPVTLSTGRCWAEVEIYPELMELVDWGVLNSGSLVCGLADGGTVSSRPLKRETALRAIPLAEQEGCIVHVLAGRSSVVRQRDIPRLAACHMGMYEAMFRRICVRTDDTLSFVRECEDPVYKLNFYHESKESRDRTRKRLEDLPMRLVHAEYSSLECSAPGVGKDSGLALLCGRLGIGPENVLAIGDSENDLSMLEIAGVPVAMGNAVDEVRSVVRLVAPDNNHDGVAEAIRRFLPRMEPPERKERKV